MNLLSAYQTDLYHLPGPASAASEAAASPSELAALNLRFAYRVALEYQGRGIPLLELISAANFGLVEAARLYDPSRGVRFISYAVWRIRRRIREVFAAAPLDGHTVSLDMAPEGERPLADMLPDAAPGPAEAAAEVEAQALVESALDVLPEVERAALCLCYGLGGQPHTLREAGAALGLSGERVRQIRDNALDRLSGAA